MTYARRVLFILAILIFSTPALAGKTLRIATEGAYPPFNHIDENGHVAGFDVDIALALCEAMNAECTIVTNEWDTILVGLHDGTYDAVIASMAKTPEREEVAAFTNYYYRSRSTFVGDPTKRFLQTREGVKGLVLGAQTDTVQAKYLRENFEGAASIKLAQTTTEAFAMLVQGKIDALLSDSLTIFDFLQTDDGKRFDFVGTPLPATDPSSEARIAVRKDDHDLIEDFNDAIRTIRLNGTYDKINRQYFPFTIY